MHQNASLKKREKQRKSKNTNKIKHRWKNWQTHSESKWNLIFAIFMKI